MTSRRFGFFFALVALTSFGLFTGCEGALVYNPADELRTTGSVCAFYWQCASRRCTAPEGGCGVCVDIRALGQPCDGPLLGCSPSATCTDGVCKSSKKTLGEPCTLGVKGELRECDDELYCRDDGSSITGTCTPRGVLGGACKPVVGCAHGADCENGVCVVARLGHEDDSCHERRCAKGLFCGSGECRRATLPIGADCGGDLIGEESCAPGGTCELTGGPPENGHYPQACTAWRKEGELCATSQCAEDFFCREPAGTHEYVCLRRLPVGQTCIFNNDCAEGLECRADVCAEACR